MGPWLAYSLKQNHFMLHEVFLSRIYNSPECPELRNSDTTDYRFDLSHIAFPGPSYIFVL